MPQPSDFIAAQPAMTAAANAGTNRRNLVVVFLAGGNCAHNTLFPRTDPNRSSYTALRPGIALPDNPATAINADWCLHPSLSGLKTIWDAGKLAIVRNVGPLVVPTTKSEYLAGSVPLPPQIYSHSDQQNLWETGIGDEPVAETGWIGRLIELLSPFNVGTTTPLLSFSGPTDSMRGFDVRTLSLGPNGLSERSGGFRLITTARTILEEVLATNVDQNPVINEYADSHRRAVAATAAISAARDLTAQQTGIPTGNLGDRMRTIVRLANGQATLGQRRSVFFLQHGGYDHHADQLLTHETRLTELDPVLLGAYNSTVSLGIDANTTFVVYSEFGRSLRQNGSGTDHGWGGHAFVFGGGVIGGLYGNPYSLDPSGPDLALSQSHMVPTTPVDTLVSTVSKWMGVPDAASGGVNPINLVAPNLDAFPVRDLNLFL